MVEGEATVAVHMDTGEVVVMVMEGQAMVDAGVDTVVEAMDNGVRTVTGVGGITTRDGGIR